MEKNNIEVNNNIYHQYGDRWYTAQDDPVALLRAESVVKNIWILEKLAKYKKTNAQILDVGCGGGFLSNALAREGYKITGVDLSAESIEVAKRYDTTMTVQYIVADAYRLPFKDQSFDVITAMDFLEHIEEPARAIHEFSRVLRSGGVFIFHTFNRNWLAGLVIIKLVEWLVRNTPKRMHILRLFIKPKELSAYCSQAGMDSKEMSGIKPIFTTLTLSSIFSGIVPLNMRFELTKSLLLSYIGLAIKR